MCECDTCQLKGSKLYPSCEVKGEDGNCKNYRENRRG